MKRCATTILLLTVGCAWAQPTLEATRAKLAPRIDGVLDEECWQGDPASGFTTIGAHEPADPKTAIQIAFSESHLYAAIRCDEPHMDELVEAVPNRDGPVYRDDAIELMLMAAPQPHPDPNYVEYAHLIINTAGIQQDRLMRGGAAVLWDGVWQAAVHKNGGGWTAELAIPFATLPITDRTGSRWRFNLARQRKANRTQLSAFAPVENSFHAPTEFATLTGLDVDFGRYRIDLVGVEIVAASGTYVARVNWRNNSDVGGAIRIEVALIGPDDVPQIQSTTVTARPGSAGSTELGPFQIVGSGEYDAHVLAKDAGGTVRRRVWLKRNIDVAPLQLTLRRPWYRNSIYPTQDIDSVVVEALLNLAPEEWPAHQLVAVVEHGDGGADIVRNATVAITGERAVLELPLPADIAPGSYRVAVALLKGDESVAAQFVPLNCLPPAPGREVRLDDQRNVTIDGEPFFPLGFMGASAQRLHLADNGYNTLHMYTLHYQPDIAKVRQTLDQFEAAGMKAVFSPFHRTATGFTGVRIGAGSYRPYFTDEETKRTVTFVRALRDHPALLGWYLCDEPRGATWHQTLGKMYDLIAEADPYHPVIALDNGAHGCVELQDAADIVWLDPYPDFLTNGGSVRPVSIVSRGINTVQQGLKRPVGVWLAQQTFDRGDFQSNARDKWRSPTYIEERCMAYMGLVEGAKAIIPYKIGTPDWEPGTPTGNRGIYSSAEMRIGMLEGVGPELAQLAPVVLMPDSPRELQCNQEAVITLLKEDGDRLYLIAVNTSPDTVSATVTVGRPQSASVHVFWEDRAIDVSKGALTDSFSGFAVHVYTTDPSLRSDRTVADVVRMIGLAGQ